MIGLASYRSIPIHTRSVSVATYPAFENAILVEGTLRDERQGVIFSITTGERIGPGIVHEIVLRLLVRGPSLTIEDVEIDYLHMPRQECHETLDSLRPLVGRSISPGFTSYVKKTFGGPKGCTHLNALLIAMAPAAVQGFWSHMVSRPISPEKVSQLMDRRLLVDSCRVWRSDGPLVEELKRAFKDGERRDNDGRGSV